MASALITKELSESDDADIFSKEDLDKALAPIASLISKSEKAQKKISRRYLAIYDAQGQSQGTIYSFTVANKGNEREKAHWNNTRG